VAQAAAQEEDLPADDIIEILQQNPDLLAEAKAQIVAHLRDRGYAVNERSITDDRLFAEIRSDDRARHVMSDELKRRGFGTEQSVESQAQPQPTPPRRPRAEQRVRRPERHPVPTHLQPRRLSPGRAKRSANRGPRRRTNILSATCLRCTICTNSQWRTSAIWNALVRRSSATARRWPTTRLLSTSRWAPIM